MANNRNALLSKLKHAIADKSASDKLWGSMTRARESRAALVGKLGLNLHAMKEANRRVKTAAVADPSLVGRFADSVRQNGGLVYLAKTGEDAVRYVVELSRRTGTRTIVKSKSLTSDEIAFTGGMEKEGIRCLETDLGELIIQLAGETPVHLVFPAAHKSVVDIAELISKALGRTVPPHHETILKVVREYLRPIFLSADMGVTGANIGVAETGSILIETNEGNGRLVTALPRIHVVIIGMEKIVPSWKDVAQLVKGHGISATGQNTTVYVSAVTQSAPLAGAEDGREFHVVILDNGRSKMRDDPWFNDALNCIRCGACMNICPTYGVAGGHTFGYIYPGPIGIPWTANVHGLDRATFAHLCVSCGLCKEICPVDIDMPLMIAKVKEQEVEGNGQLIANSFFMASESLARIASATAPLSNWILRTSAVRYLMELSVGVDRRRTLPAFSRKRLRPRLAQLAQGAGEAGRVVFFPDIYADYNDPRLGVRAVKMLHAAGYRVEVPDLKWSGMPYISYGDLKRAAETARYNLMVLERYLNDGYDIVSTEPTAVYMLREVYPKLVPGGPALRARERSYPFFGFISDKVVNLDLKPCFPSDERVGFHISCHDRALSSGEPAVAFLRAAGYDVQVVETGTCCGMAGTFGMKHGDLGYNLSVAVGERLFDVIAKSGCRLVATESSVCAMQITDGTRVRVVHPLYMVEEMSTK